MDKRLVGLLSLVFITIVIHSIYVILINPQVAVIAEQALIEGTPLPRNFFVILKDLEQEFCLILFFWSMALCLQKYIEISSMDYLFDVDLFDDADLDANKAIVYLTELEQLDDKIKSSSLVEILSSSLRRFALTKNIESAANAIEPALEIMSVKNDNNLSIIKYIAWAIPSIGFLGTVRGIGQAMSQAKEAVGGDIGPMTSSLGVAFNSTFVALIVSVFLMMVLTYLQNEQDSQLVRIKAYTEKYLINRIRHD